MMADKRMPMEGKNVIFENTALSLFDLKKMRGEPVWCKETGCYGIVKMEKAGRFANELFLVGVMHDGDVAINFEYNIKVRRLTLYRHKPDTVHGGN